MRPKLCAYFKQNVPSFSPYFEPCCSRGHTRLWWGMCVRRDLPPAITICAFREHVQRFGGGLVGPTSLGAWAVLSDHSPSLQASGAGACEAGLDKMDEVAAQQSGL